MRTPLLGLLLATTAFAQMSETLRSTSLDLSTGVPMQRRPASECSKAGPVTPIAPAAQGGVEGLRKAHDALLRTQSWDNLGRCLTGENGSVVSLGGAAVNENFRKGKLAAFIKEDGTRMTAADWRHVDMLSRLLVGEIATRGRCGDGYVKALGRVVMNRVGFVERDPKNSWKQFAGERGPGVDPWDAVIMHKNGFSAMSEDSDANRWVRCPPGHILQKYKFEGENPFATADKENVNWERAVDVAREMIMAPAAFRQQTNSLTNDALFYTVGDGLHDKRLDQGYLPIPKARVDGVKIDERRCLELWRDPNVQSIPE